MRQSFLCKSARTSRNRNGFLPRGEKRHNMHSRFCFVYIDRSKPPHTHTQWHYLYMCKCMWAALRPGCVYHTLNGWASACRRFCSWVRLMLSRRCRDGRIPFRPSAAHWQATGTSSFGRFSASRTETACPLLLKCGSEENLCAIIMKKISMEPQAFSSIYIKNILNLHNH